MSGVERKEMKMEKKNAMVELREKAETYRSRDKTLAISEVIFWLLIVFSMIATACLGYGSYKHFFWVGTASVSVFGLLSILAGRSMKQNKREFDEWCNQKKLDLFFEYSIEQCNNFPHVTASEREKLAREQNTYHTFSRVVDGLRTNPNMKIPDSAEPAKSETV